MWEAEVEQVLICFLHGSSVPQSVSFQVTTCAMLAVNRERGKQNYTIVTTTLIRVAHQKTTIERDEPTSLNAKKPASPGQVDAGLRRCCDLPGMGRYPSREGSSIQ